MVYSGKQVRDPKNPQNPKNPKNPKNPRNPGSPKIPKSPKALKALKTLKILKSPKPSSKRLWSGHPALLRGAVRGHRGPALSGSRVFVCFRV